MVVKFVIIVYPVNLHPLFLFEKHGLVCDPAFWNPYFGPFLKFPDPKEILGRPDKLK